MSNAENERLHDAFERLLALATASESGRAGAVGEGLGPAAAHLPDLQGALGHYRLLRPLGHGGQGLVYLAEDTRLGRQVALKLLSVGGAVAPTTRARFEREATAASRLRHPGICTVYEAGEIDGQRFLAMEFVDGEGLTDWVARTTAIDASSESTTRRARVDRALDLVEQIARAVHTAHEAGVVHRDLKPQNIMLRRDGSPVVLDFGLARDDSQDGAALTMQGDVLGTPAYMPPERVRGTAGTADPREDVYGLGAILYECLTGRRPFWGHTREQLYQRILTAPVDDPRDVDRAIPREAHFVVETALEKAPDRRYATALDLAEDVRRLRLREPIQARPVPAWLRLQRWVQRHPGAAIPTIAAFVVLIVGVITALALLARVGAESRQTRIRALLAESALEVGRDPQRALLLARAAHQQLDEGAPDELRTDVRSQLIEVLAQTRRVRELPHRGTAVGAAFSGDGRRATTVYNGSIDAPVRVWQIDDGSPPLEYRMPEPGNDGLVTSCAFDEGRERVLLTAASGIARVVSMTDAELLHELVPAARERAPITFKRPPDIEAARSLAAFVPGHRDLVVTGSNDGARLWRLVPGQVAGVEVWHDERADWRTTHGVCQIAVSADGALCAAGEHDGTIRLLRIDGGALVGGSRLHTAGIHALAFDPDRPLLVSSAMDGRGAMVWWTDRATAMPPNDPPGLAAAGEIDLDGMAAIRLLFDVARPERKSALVILDDDRTVQLYRDVDATPRYERSATVRGNSADVRDAAFSPDGSRLLTASLAGLAQVLDLQGNRLDRLLGADNPMAVAWAPSGDRVLAVNQMGPVQVWRAEDPAFRVVHAPRSVTRLAAAGSRVVAGLRRGSLLVLDLETGAIAEVQGTVRYPLQSMALRDDGRRLACGGDYGRLDLWDLSGATPVAEPAPRAFGAAQLIYDSLDFGEDGALFVATPTEVCLLRPDGAVESLVSLPSKATVAFVAGRAVATGDTYTIWDCAAGTATPDNVATWGNEYSRPLSATSRDRRWLATLGGKSGLVRVVDVRGRRVARELTQPLTRGIALSADGSLLLTSGLKGHARLWDLGPQPPRLIAELRGHVGTVWSTCFSPDDREVITGGSDGTIRFWPAHFDRLDELVEERLVRDWTDAERARYAELIDR